MGFTPRLRGFQDRSWGRGLESSWFFFGPAPAATPTRQPLTMADSEGALPPRVTTFRSTQALLASPICLLAQQHFRTGSTFPNKTQQGHLPAPFLWFLEVSILTSIAGPSTLTPMPLLVWGVPLLRDACLASGGPLSLWEVCYEIATGNPLRLRLCAPRLYTGSCRWGSSGYTLGSTLLLAPKSWIR